MTTDTDTVVTTAIALGRKGNVTSDGLMSLEVQRFAGNRPTVTLITGICINGELQKKRIYPYSSYRTGGDNGFDYYELEDGIYFVDDILSTSSRRYSTFIVLENGELDKYSRSELDEVLATQFAGDLAAAAEARREHQARVKLAQEVLVEIVEDRKGLVDPVTDGDLTAHPEFDKLPSAERVVQEMSNKDFNRADYVIKHASAFKFVVHKPVFAVGSTPQAAFDKARETIEKRKQELQEALSQAGHAGWPQLKGSEKQIAWAERIRAKLAAIHPENRALKTATTAKYWIETWSHLR